MPFCLLSLLIILCSFAALIPYRMIDRFAAGMAKRTDKELIQIVSVDRNDYQPLAVEAAEAEIRKRNLDMQFIQETTANLEKQQQQKRVENAGKIDVGARAIHFFVDTFLYYVLGFVLAIAGVWIAYFIKGAETEVGIFSTLIGVMILLGFFLYYLGMEFFFQRTVGKFITGSKVIMADGSKPQFEDILRRTACRLIPFDAISFLFRQEGFHDSLSNTKVVNIKEHEALTSSANTPESSSPAI